jgi:multiple antibiotic resistance protein
MYSFFLLFVSMLCGGKILSFFGIALYSVQIGGGIIVAANGWLLLTKDAQKDNARHAQSRRGAEPGVLSVHAADHGRAGIDLGGCGAGRASAHAAAREASFISPDILAASILGTLVTCADCVCLLSLGALGGECCWASRERRY